MKQTSLSDLDFRLTITLRECEVGEQFTSAGKCVDCPEGTSFSLTKMKEPGNCE